MLQEHIFNFILTICIFQKLQKHEATALVLDSKIRMDSQQSETTPENDILNKFLHYSINHSENDGGFKCQQEWPSLALKETLICYCKDKKEDVKIRYDSEIVTPGWEKINDEIIKNKSQDHLSKLYLINCSFTIGTKAFEQLKLTRLSNVYVAGSDSLVLLPDSLVFTNTNVKVKIYQIENQFHFPNLHSSVSTLVLEKVHLGAFSTDNFISSDQATTKGSSSSINDIIIKNSNISTANQNATLKVKVGSITFDRIRILSPPTHLYFNIVAKRFVKFKNIVLEPGDEHLFDFVSKNLIFEDCTLKYFSTERFLAGSQNVLIKNGEIIPHKWDSIEKKTFVMTFTFENVKFRKSPKFPFINLAVMKNITFRGIELKANNEELITVKTETLSFENCTIKNWGEKAIVASADHVNFKNTTLKKLGPYAMMDLHPWSNISSTLSLANIALERPLEGALASRFPNLHYKNIRVDKCKCDLAETLLADDYDFREILVDEKVSTVNETFNITTQKLINRFKREHNLSENTLCYHQSEWIQPKKECKNRVRGIPGISIGAVLILLIIMLSIALFRYRRRVKENVNLIDKWTIVEPKKLRPVSRIGLTASDTPGFEIDLSTGTCFEPNMSDSGDPKVLRIKNHYIDSLKLNHDIALSKSSKSIDESQRGSVIVHEDVYDI